MLYQGSIRYASELGPSGGTLDTAPTSIYYCLLVVTTPFVTMRCSILKSLAFTPILVKIGEICQI